MNGFDEIIGSPLSIIRRAPPTTVDAWLGLDSASYRPGGLVDVGECITLSLNAYGHFQSERFFVRRAIAGDFLIRNVFIGNISGGAINNEPIIADAFATDLDKIAEISEALFDGRVIQLTVDKEAVELLGSPWRLPVIRPAIPSALQVENIGERPLRFLAAFYGKSIRS